MEYRIALMLKKHYYSQISDLLKEQDGDVDLQFFGYETLDELNGIFRRIRNDFDGFVVSGIFPLQSLRISGCADESTLIEPCPVNVENIFQILLRQMILKPDLKLSRVGMDFFRDEGTLEDLILSGQFAENVHSHEERWKTFSTMEELIREENSVTERYEKLFSERKIDVIITYFYSAVESMGRHGIDCFYAYPSKSMFTQIIEKLKDQISLRALKDTLSAVIHIDMEELHKLDNDSCERYQLELNRVVMEFNRQNYNKLILKNNYNDLELYTDCSVVKRLTSGFRECHLWERLHRELGFNSSIGYGIGSSLHHARVNAIDACHYGRNGGAGGGGSFLIDENEKLTVLDTGKEIVVFQVDQDYVNQIANKVKLSAETIVRLIGIMDTLDTDELSFRELMTGLNISRRSANKFLSSLESSGYAFVVQQKRNGNKGRPVNVYKLKLKYKEEG